MVQATEAEGANVTALIATLNSAGLLLTQAELAYSAKNYSLASSLALQSSNTLSSFDGTAAALKNSALQDSNQILVTNVVSLVAALAIVAGGVILWVRLGKTGVEAVSN